MNTLALIPARGGSKGIPRKNVLPLKGVPLIQWTIHAAQETGLFSNIIVSTDDEEIAEVSRQANANVPFMRPDFLASDTATSTDVIKHCLDFLEKEQGFFPETLVLLQPTSPFRSAEDIEKALTLFKESGANFTLSVSPAQCPVEWFVELDDRNQHIQKIDYSSQTVANRQAGKKWYVPNGAIYIAKTEKFLETSSWYDNTTRGYIMPVHRSLDLDEPFDWHLAECLSERPFQP